MTVQEREGLDSRIESSTSKDFSEWARRALLNGAAVPTDPRLVIAEIGKLRELSLNVSTTIDEIVTQIGAGAYTEDGTERTLIDLIERYLELKQEMIEAVRMLYRVG